MNKKPVFMVILTTILISFAQVLYKFGTAKLSFSIEGLILNYFLIGGLVLYGIGAAILIIALKNDNLSTLYPIIATGYVWVLILSNYFFHEELNYLKWLGVITIVVGIGFIGWGSKTEQYAGAVE